MSLAASHRRDPVPGLIAAAIVLCVYGGDRALSGLLARGVRHPERRGDLLHDGPQPGRRRRPRLPPRRPGAGVARVSRRARPACSSRRAPTSNCGRQAARRSLTIDRRPDPDTAQLFYGKSYIYPLVAAPFVALFGTNGFLVFHASCWRWSARRVPLPERPVVARRVARAGLGVPHGVGGADVLRLDHAGTVQLQPRAARRISAGSTRRSPRPRRRPAARRGSSGPAPTWRPPRSLGLATFSKPSNLLLILPLLAWLLVRRQWKRRHPRRRPVRRSSGRCSSPAIWPSRATGTSRAATGARSTGRTRSRNAARPWEEVGQDRATNRVLTGITLRPARLLDGVLPQPRAISSSDATRGCCRTSSRASSPLSRSCWPAESGRHGSGWSSAPRRPKSCCCSSGCPYTYNGGGGSVGNRYFMSTYGVLLFLLPPIASAAWARRPVGRRRACSRPR